MYNHHRMASMNDFFGQLWKEYALSDSRYMASDPFVLCMESWTAVRPSPLNRSYQLLKTPPLRILPTHAIRRSSGVPSPS